MEVFVAALSFEERAIAGFAAWAEDRIRQESGLLLIDYESSATPGHAAARLREKRYEQFLDIARRFDTRVLRASCQAYSSRALIRVLSKSIRVADVASYTIDISCLTRPHLMGCASFLSESEPTENWAISYSMPRAYGAVDDHGQASRLRDILSLPLNPSVRLRNQGLSIGIMVLGHDVSRVGLALNEIEPSAGVMLICGNNNRPDYERMSMGRNKLAIDHLLGLRLSGTRSAQLSSTLGSSGWRLDRLDLDSSTIISQSTGIAAKIYTAAATINPRAQIALFPFGPKLASFAIAYALCSLGGDNVVVVIPTYKTHDTNYSQGLASTKTYGRHAFDDAVEVALAPLDAEASYPVEEGFIK